MSWGNGESVIVSSRAVWRLRDRRPGARLCPPGWRLVFRRRGQLRPIASFVVFRMRLTDVFLATTAIAGALVRP